MTATPMILSISCEKRLAKGNEFYKKITYKAQDDQLDADGNIIEHGEAPKTLLSNFRNSYNPRIAVTVDMIATGTERASA